MRSFSQTLNNLSTSTTKKVGEVKLSGRGEHVGGHVSHESGRVAKARAEHNFLYIDGSDTVDRQFTIIVHNLVVLDSHN